MEKVYRLNYDTEKLSSTYIDTFRSKEDALTFCNAMNRIDKNGMYFITQQKDF